MKTLHRNKRKLYLCQLYVDNKIKKYKEPIELRENWEVTNTDSDFKNLGLEAYNYVRVKTSLSNANLYHLGDRAYINMDIPDVHDPLCKTANYEVSKDPIVTLNECEVLFKRLSGRTGDTNVF